MPVLIEFTCDACGKRCPCPPYSRTLPSARQEIACSARCRDALLARVDARGVKS